MNTPRGSLCLLKVTLAVFPRGPLSPGLSSPSRSSLFSPKSGLNLDWLTGSSWAPLLLSTFAHAAPLPGALIFPSVSTRIILPFPSPSSELPADETVLARGQDWGRGPSEDAL